MKAEFNAFKTNYERRHSYVCKKGPRGTWYTKFYYIDWNGVKKQKKKEGFLTKKEAQDYEREFLAKQEISACIPLRNLTERYMKDCEARLKPTTFANKKAIIDTKILPYFGDVPICDITELMVREWQNKLIADEKEFEPTYLKTIHNQLSAIMNYGVKFFKLPFNPAAKCGSMGKKKADCMQFWTKDEFNAFIQAVSDKPLSKVVFNLLFYSGMREGELLALTYNDFDFDKNTVNINKTYAVINSTEIIQPPKTPKSTRVVSLPVEIMNMVQEYYGMLYDYDPNARLFATSKSALTREMERGCKLSGVKRIRIHDIRHSHASLLIEMGVVILLVSERLGHENIETTLGIYSHLYPNKDENVAKMLSDVINV